MLEVSKFAVCHWETCARFPRPAILRKIEIVTNDKVTAAQMLEAYQAHLEKALALSEPAP